MFAVNLNAVSCSSRRNDVKTRGGISFQDRNVIGSFYPKERPCTNHCWSLIPHFQSICIESCAKSILQ